MRDIGDIKWLAGILEGEGHFSMPASTGGTPSIQLSMNRGDVIRRAAQLFQVPPHEI